MAGAIASIFYVIMEVKPMYFDTHAHYDDRRFNDDREELLGSMPDAGVTLILNAASSLWSVGFGLEMADKYPFMYYHGFFHMPGEFQLFPETLSLYVAR